MSAATVVWLAEAAGEPRSAPSDEARRALEAWAKARGVELAPPREAAAPALAIDWSAGERVERGLGRVRDALAGLDLDAAERELARAEGTLRDHPELPQAAWLRAEVARAWSARWLRSGDEERAKRAWQRAAGLDGGREAGLGEKGFAPEATITATIRLRGDGGDALRLDGAIVPPGDVARTAGEHALAIVSPEGATLWADWVSLAPGSAVEVEAPAAPACSRADVGRARGEAKGERVDAAGVRCGAWVAALASGSGAVVRVATCAGGTCGPLVEWRAIASGPSGWTSGPVAPSTEPASRARWPAWATWTLAGVGVVGAAVGVAAAAGAFRSSPAPETQFVNGGIQVHAF